MPLTDTSLPSILPDQVTLRPSTAVGLLLDIAHLPGEFSRTCGAQLPPEEQAQFNRIQLAPERHLRMSTRWVLRQMLGQLTGVAPADVKLQTGPQGKPELASGGAVRFNVSHSGQFGLLAFAQGAEIGCDIERQGRVNDVAALCDAVCHPDETAAVRMLPAAAAEEAFLRCWVRKEAVLKALGVGFSVDPRQVNVGFSGPVVQLDKMEGLDPSATSTTLHMHCTTPAPGYAAAVAVAGRSAACEWRQLLL